MGYVLLGKQSEAFCFILKTTGDFYFEV